MYDVPVRVEKYDSTRDLGKVIILLGIILKGRSDFIFTKENVNIMAGSHHTHHLISTSKNGKGSV